MLHRRQAEILFLKHRRWIERVAAILSRRRGMWGADAEDFASWLKLRLIEDDYAAIRRFRGGSQIQTYLVVVVSMEFQKYHRERDGRWQRSAAAERLGGLAKNLEALVYRDGYSLAQALEGKDPGGDVIGALDHVMARLEPEEHLIARMHFREGLSVSEVARGLSIDPSLVARQVERLRREIRSHMQDVQLPELHHPGILGPDGLPMTQEDLQGSRIILDVISTNEKLLRMVVRDPQSVYDLSPRQFEELVAELLHKQGYEIVLTPPSNDGGFDMYAARKDGIGEFLYLVECKRYAAARPVGVDLVRSLHGVVQKEQASAGILVTTSRFTKCAAEFQQSVRHRLSLRDYLHLQQWIVAGIVESAGS